MDLKEITLKVCGIARQAGKYLKNERENFSLDNVEEKRTHDYVSYVDKTSEKMIVEALKKLLPEAGFIAEEGSGTYQGEEYVWAVDPLDGTTNYIHNNAPYNVSIGLRTKNEILAGVVYEVCRDECFYAWKGGGAYLNGRAIKTERSNSMDKALICMDLPYCSEKYGPTVHHLMERLYGRAGGIRMNGSAAASLCYVAAGRFEGYLEKYIGIWDFTAGALIVTEAGGTVTDFYGNENFIDGDNIVASNGTIHEELLKVLREKMPE